jgi:hypothetical protein
MTSSIPSIYALKKHVKDPLLKAICHEDHIDAEIILSEKGAHSSPGMLLRGDEHGRTPLHLACLASNTKVLKSIMNCYHTFTVEQLDRSLDKLSQERRESIAQVRASAGYLSVTEEKEGTDCSND